MLKWFTRPKEEEAEPRGREKAASGADEFGNTNDEVRTESIAEQADAAVRAELREYAQGKGLSATTVQRTSSSSWSAGDIHVEATPRGLEVASRTVERHPDQDALAAGLSKATGFVTRSSVHVTFYDSKDYNRSYPKGGRAGTQYTDGKKTEHSPSEGPHA